MPRGLFGVAPKYDTPLTPEQEVQFQEWARQQGRLADLQDYDLRGAWLANVQQAQNGHYPDTFKKPNHPTFSTDSQYSGQGGLMGGQWADAGNGRWNFWASPDNLRSQSVMGLAEYFRRKEPGNAVFFPFNYKLPPR